MGYVGVTGICVCMYVCMYVYIYVYIYRDIGLGMFPQEWRIRKGNGK